MIKEYNLLDCVEMKKPHPCVSHSKVFQIVRLGADIKIRCLGCGNYIMLERHIFEEKARKLVERVDSKYLTKEI